MCGQSHILITEHTTILTEQSILVINFLFYMPLIIIGISFLQVFAVAFLGTLNLHESIKSLTFPFENQKQGFVLRVGRKILMVTQSETYFP